jgi:hypothetical protein
MAGLPATALSLAMRIARDNMVAKRERKVEMTAQQAGLSEGCCWVRALWIACTLQFSLELILCPARDAVHNALKF